MSDFEDKLGAILNDPQAMGKIMSLAQSLAGGENQAKGTDESQQANPTEWNQADSERSEGILRADGLDPGMIEMGIRLLREYNSVDNRSAALLEALRPFVRTQRYKKVDRAVQIARLSRVVRVRFEVMKENGGPFHV